MFKGKITGASGNRIYPGKETGQLKTIIEIKERDAEITTKAKTQDA